MTKICAHETSTYITGCTATTFPIEEGRIFCLGWQLIVFTSWVPEDIAMWITKETVTDVVLKEWREFRDFN